MDRSSNEPTAPFYPVGRRPRSRLPTGGKIFTFCRGRQSGSFADGRFLGAWIDEYAVTELPQEMELRLPTNEVIVLAVWEAFYL